MPATSTSPSLPHGWRLEHSYAQLPSVFHVAYKPTPVSRPEMVILNRPLAESLGLDPASLDNPALFAGNALPPGAHPLAQAYAGHQFGNFTMLGDGRAILLGEQLTPDGERFDIQLKGSGQTPFSRRGDGRATLGPMLREYVISEAMDALGIPTTRSLAVVTTGEVVYRTAPLPGAVLTRVAASHIRVGTFEYAAALDEKPNLQALADYTIQRHYPQAATTAQPYAAFLDAVIERQAALIARWQLVGFIHGVMNTDNMALSGETIDYGPCAFMEAYDPATVFSSIDHGGRYAYGSQPQIAQWNLARLAESLLPLIHQDAPQALDIANESIGRFGERFQHHWLVGMRAKLGLFTEESDDPALIDSLLEWMQRSQADFTNTFRALSSASSAMHSPEPAYREWHQRWQDRLTRQTSSASEVMASMRRHNPAIIPRNHKVEEALAAAVGNGDLRLLERLLAVLANPYDHTQEHPEEFSLPSKSEAYQTFCGT
ncbi:YdiU family protein [Roseimicrobium sp. ORNL1]|uniref:protein adenylyltransferase SelO n=1 Tax=Roseimicrobium sp. ORNL1 TaxID=2711231 RepID=UPI0013E2046F|nr:YdiU family protein [Roseimicrobium sp. ORNL1]QIF03129.1 YdiU family protein [Roseimicrobium sp. ORNL1]